MCAQQQLFSPTHWRIDMDKEPLEIPYRIEFVVSDNLLTMVELIPDFNVEPEHYPLKLVKKTKTTKAYKVFDKADVLVKLLRNGDIISIKLTINGKSIEYINKNKRT